MSSTPIAVGQTAPDFTLKTQDKEEWSLAEQVKKGDVVLCFIPFAFSGPCGIEMECVSKEMARWEKEGANFVGINCDSFFANKAWVDAMGYKQTILADMHREVCKAYGMHWADLNTTTRGTIVIGQSDDGVGTVKFAEAREPANTMDFDSVMAKLA